MLSISPIYEQLYLNQLTMMQYMSSLSAPQRQDEDLNGIFLAQLMNSESSLHPQGLLRQENIQTSPFPMPFQQFPMNYPPNRTNSNEQRIIYQNPVIPSNFPQVPSTQDRAKIQIPDQNPKVKGDFPTEIVQAPLEEDNGLKDDNVAKKSKKSRKKKINAPKADPTLPNNLNANPNNQPPSNTQIQQSQDIVQSAVINLHKPEEPPGENSHQTSSQNRILASYLGFVPPKPTNLGQMVPQEKSPNSILQKSKNLTPDKEKAKIALPQEENFKKLINARKDPFIQNLERKRNGILRTVYWSLLVLQVGQARANFRRREFSLTISEKIYKGLSVTKLLSWINCF